MFLQVVGEGVEGAEAFTQAFGSDTSPLQRELFNYVRRIVLNARRFEFDEKIATGATSNSVVISDHEAAGYLGELIANDPQRVDETRAYLQKAIDSGSDAVQATAALGRLELRAGNEEAALSLLERAISLNGDSAMAQRSYGRLLASRAERAGLEAPARARTALIRAHELEPNNAATAKCIGRGGGRRTDAAGG